MNKLRKNSKKKSTYASNKIEGNPLSEKQVDEVIENDERKHYLKPEQEVRNYFLALNFLEQKITRKEKFSKKLILDVQKLVEKGASKEKIGFRGPMPPGVLFAVYDSKTGRPDYIPPEYCDIPNLLDELVTYVNTTDDHPLIVAAVVHYQLVTIHPFEDGNGRTARILNASQLYHAGYRKMKSLPLSSAINNQLSGYYSSLADSETVLGGAQGKWLDISPFVSFMMDAFEHCLIDAALADNALTEAEKKLLERMNHAGIHAEITTKKAAGILQMSDSGTRAVLNGLVNKGYLTVEKDGTSYVYRLHQHIPE